MLNPKIEANTHTATRPSRLLQRIFAVLLSVENSRFIKKMTEHFVRALEMRKRSILAIADYRAVSQRYNRIKKSIVDNIPCLKRVDRSLT